MIRFALILAWTLAATPAWGATYHLGWNDIATGETGWEIYRCVALSCTYGPVSGSPAAANATTFDDTTAADETNYKYRIRAAYGGGVYGVYSNEACAPSACSPAPSTNVHVTGESTPGQIALTASMSGGSCAPGVTVCLADGQASTVQAGLNAALAGQIIGIPTGTWAWTTKVTWDAPLNVTLMGAGTCTGTPPSSCDDATVIIDNDVTHSDRLLQIWLPDTGTFRLSGITFRGGSGIAKENGLVSFEGLLQSFRLDHNHFDCDTTNPTHHTKITFFKGLFGLVDHNMLDAAASTGCSFDIWHDSLYGSTDQNANQSWAYPTALGSNQYLVFEANTWNNPGTADNAANDSSHGARYVFRYNTFNRTGIQNHPTGGAGEGRGSRITESYGNTFTGNNTYPNYRAHYFNSGSAIVWGNTESAGYNQFISMDEARRDTYTYPQLPPPDGWGYCGTAYGPSDWDGNLDTYGYPCIDQIGRGRGDLVSGSFPTKINTVYETVHWPNQVLEPIYEWSNTHGGVGTFYGVLPRAAEIILLDRDYYRETTPFTGASGVGSGLLAARPATCTHPAVGGGVAYWATDLNLLFQCSATNTWTPYYAPYIYPHPLSSTTWTQYSTTFTQTENPMSQGSLWLQGATDGTNWSNVRTTAGMAYGTQSGLDDPPYNDSIAVLKGTWGTNYTVTGVVKITGAVEQWQEVEVHLRATITAGSIYSYEVNCSVVSSDPYIQVIKWKGAWNGGDFWEEIDGRGNAGDYCITGDTLSGSISGSTITVKHNGATVLTVVDTAITSGNPGIGFYNAGDGSSANFGFSAVSVTTP